MDKIKERIIFKKADKRNPFMGLYNIICENPKYWCRLHQVWLSGEDVTKKHCKQKTSFDMLDTQICNCLEEKSIDSN